MRRASWVPFESRTAAFSALGVPSRQEADARNRKLGWAGELAVLMHNVSISCHALGHLRDYLVRRCV